VNNNFTTSSLFNYIITSNFFLATCFMNIPKRSISENFGLICYTILSLLWVFSVVLYAKLVEVNFLKKNFAKVIYNDAINFTQTSNKPATTGTGKDEMQRKNKEKRKDTNKKNEPSGITPITHETNRIVFNNFLSVSKFNKTTVLNTIKTAEHIKVRTVNDFTKTPFKTQLEIDKRGFFKYYWDEVKYNHEFLNLFFYFSIINPHFIRISLFFLSLTLKLGISCLFFSDYYIKQQNQYKTMFGSNSTNGFFVFTQQFMRTLWPMFFSVLIKNLVNMLLFMPKKYIIELNENLVENPNCIEKG